MIITLPLLSGLIAVHLGRRLKLTKLTGRGPMYQESYRTTLGHTSKCFSMVLHITSHRAPWWVNALPSGIHPIVTGLLHHRPEYSIGTPSETGAWVWTVNGPGRGNPLTAMFSRWPYMIQLQPFNGLFSRTTWVSRYQKGKTNLDFTGAIDSEWQWHRLCHMQVCTSLQTDNHASTSPLCFLQAGCPSCRPTNSVKALKAQALKAHGPTW